MVDLQTRLDERLAALKKADVSIGKIKNTLKNSGLISSTGEVIILVTQDNFTK